MKIIFSYLANYLYINICVGTIRPGSDPCESQVTRRDPSDATFVTLTCTTLHMEITSLVGTRSADALVPNMDSGPGPLFDIATHRVIVSSIVFGLASTLGIASISPERGDSKFCSHDYGTYDKRIGYVGYT